MPAISLCGSDEKRRTRIRFKDTRILSSIFGSNSTLPKVLGQYGGDAEVRQPSAGTCRYGRVEGGREGRGRELEGVGVVLSNKVEDNN